MAVTMPKKLPSPIGLDSYLSYAVRYHGEAATQTFTAGAPVINSSGYVAQAADQVTSGVIGMALRAGQNGTAAGDATSEYVLAVEQLSFHISFLTSTDASDNVLAQTDWMTSYDLTLYATAWTDDPTSVGGWYLEDATNGVGARIISFNSDYVPPNQVATESVAGDTNARVEAVFLGSVVAYNG